MIPNVVGMHYKSSEDSVNEVKFMQKTRQAKPALILILGLMTALSPFSIDMYLPAFQSIASDFQSTTAQVSLSLSSYFIGLSFGQLFYGPLLDRYGRKRPLYVGLAIYILSSLFCLVSQSTQSLIIWRFVQAIGGCAAGVTAMTMVRDLFSVKESAKIYSLLILILGISPLLAPTVGGYISSVFGWHSVFICLALIASVLLINIWLFLPETHVADPSVSLKLGSILKNFAIIVKNVQFHTYVFSGAIGFSALYIYLAGSTVIFLDHFHVSPQIYGWIFATIAAGLIGASQLNSVLLKRFNSEQIVSTALMINVFVGLIFVIGVYLNWFNLIGTIIMFFLFLCCFGLINPNSGALSLAPFSKNAGSASALMGFIQMGIGAAMSSMIGVFGITKTLTIISMMASCSLIAYIILIIGRSRIRRRVHVHSSTTGESAV